MYLSAQKSFITQALLLVTSGYCKSCCWLNPTITLNLCIYSGKVVCVHVNVPNVSSLSVELAVVHPPPFGSPLLCDLVYSLDHTHSFWLFVYSALLLHPSPTSLSLSLFLCLCFYVLPFLLSLTSTNTHLASAPPLTFPFFPHTHASPLKLSFRLSFSLKLSFLILLSSFASLITAASLPSCSDHSFSSSASIEL